MLDRDTFHTDPFVRGIIVRKVRLLLRRVGFAAHEAEDIEQELLLRLLQSLDGYDPSQCRHANVFVTTVVERAAGMILRERTAKKRAAGCVRSLDDLLRLTGGDADEPHFERPGPAPRPADDVFDLAHDVAAVVAGLPPDLRDLAERLRRQTPSQAARDLGVPLGTLQRRRDRLRQLLEEAGLGNFP